VSVLRRIEKGLPLLTFGAREGARVHSVVFEARVGVAVKRNPHALVLWARERGCRGVMSASCCLVVVETPRLVLGARGGGRQIETLWRGILSVALLKQGRGSVVALE